MALLVFKVNADYEKVIKLREEISKLKEELKGTNSSLNPQLFNTLNDRLQKSSAELKKMTSDAEKAGVEFENGFKKKIYDASSVVNDLTKKIIEQKDAVKNTAVDVRRLGDAYRALPKNTIRRQEALKEYNSAKMALDEERAALFQLQQQQASARLSVKELKDEYALYKNEAEEAVNITDIFGKSFKKTLATLGIGYSLKSLVSNIVKVRGEFQATETAISTLLGGDIAKTQSLMSEIKEFAKVSPLEFKDVTSATQMMLGFNIEAEKVPKFIRAIGDVSMGEKGKFNSLSLAFSQMSAAGKLMGQDLNQMINAGFNPLTIMSEKTGKSISELKDEMSKGAISAEMVQQAFIDATEAGGKFYNMSENASKTINGQLSMMQDAIDAAFNEIGEASEGVIVKGIQLTTTLIENYDTIGRVLIGLVSTYGTYKAAMLASLVIEQTKNKTLLANIKATKAYTIVQAQLNKVAKANPYVLLASAIIGVGVAMYSLISRSSKAAKASAELTSNIQHETKGLDELFGKLKNTKSGTDERKKAIDEINGKYPQYLGNLLTEKSTMQEIASAYESAKKKVIEYNLERSREDYLTKPIEKLNKATITFYTQFDDWSKKLENSVQRGKFKSYVDQIIEKVKEGGAFSIEDVENAFRAAQSKGEYKTVNEWLEAFRRGEESFGSSVLDKIGGWDYGDLEKAGKTLETYSKSLINARKEFDEFSESYLRAASPEEPKKENTYQQDLEKAKKDWEEAKKALEAIEKDKSKFTTKQYETAKAAKDAAEKRYKNLGGKTDKTLSKEESDAEKLNEKLLSLRRKNQQDEISLMKEGTDKKLKQIEADFKAQKQKIEKEQKEFAKENKKLKISGLNSNGLTKEQQKEIGEANRLNEENRKKSESEVYKSEIASMRDYLKEYGTFQQKKLAIAEEYAEKIKKAQNEGERLRFEKESDSAIRQVDIDALRQNIDWATIFGEFGGMFSDIIKPALAEAKKYRDSDEFKNLDQSSQKDLIDAINQMEKSIGQSGKISFKKLGKDIQSYQQSLNELNDAKQAEISAIEDLKKAQEKYDKAIKEGTEQEKNVANQALENAKNNANAASRNVRTQEMITQNSQQIVSDSATKLRIKMDNVTEGLSKLASGGIRSAYDGLIQAGKGMGGAMAKIADKLESVPIIGWIVSIIDMFKDGLSFVIGGLLDAIFNAVSGIVGDILSGDLFVTIFKSLRDGIGKILNSLTFGGWNSWMSSSNAKEVAKTTERLTNSNERLKDSVDKLKDEMSKTGGWKAIDAAQQAKKDQEQINKQSMDILMAQMGYHGAHHSNAYYWNLSKSDYASLNQSLADYAKKNPNVQVDKNYVSSLEDIYKLTPEQLDYIRTYNIEMWEKMIDQGKYDKSEYWEQYADLAGKLEEINEALKETLTQISFDSLRSSFIDTLMDMDKSAEDFADDFSNYMMRSILNAKISDMLDDELKSFYNKWAEYAESGNEITKAEQDELKNQWDEITKKGLEIRDQIADITGYGSSESYSQEASSKGFQAMSQDVGEELNGRFTALQISNEEIKNQSVSQNEKLGILSIKIEDLKAIASEGRNIADEIRTILANSYLELQQINENTGAIIKPIKTMATDIAEVKKNTSRI